MTDRILTILLIEDNNGDARIVKELLAESTSTAFVSKQAGTLAEGLALLAESPFAAILLDLGLPDSMGLATYTRLQGAFPDTPTIIMTGLDDEATSLLAVRSGAEDYLVKNALSSRDLIKSILYAVERCAAKSEIRQSVLRMACLLEIAHHEAEPVQELLDFTLEKALQITCSLVGFICFYREDLQEFSVSSWAQQTSGGYRVVASRAIYPLERAGIWSDVVRQRKPVIANAYSDATWLKTVEDGGAVELRNFMTVPVLDADRIVAVIGVGNRPSDYQPFDADQLVLMADFAWKSVQRSRAEEALRELNAELEKKVAERTAELQSAMQDLEAFSYTLSHDLKNPVAAILGIGTLMLENPDQKLDAVSANLAQKICKSARRMDDLIRDILMLCRLSREESVAEEVNLSLIASEILGTLREQNQERVCATQIAEGLWAHGDARLLRIVLENLLSNAWKFTSENPDASIEVGKINRDGSDIYYVHDNGAGFDMALAEQLFTPFRRLHSQDKFPGTGVGLATVRRIVEKHGGRVWATSSLNEGATFYFTLSASASIEGEA